MPAPRTVDFEGLKRPGPGLRSSRCFYEALGFRPPRKGEFYLSGAIPMAYRAKADLAAAYQVVRPTHFAIVPDHARQYVPGPAVTLKGA